MAPRNVDVDTVRGFGEEWSSFDQSARSIEDLRATFDRYFALFPWDRLGSDAVGFDAGCGSGRWAAFVAPRVGRLVAVDPSPDALAVAARALAGHQNAEVVLSSAGALPFADGSMDFGYSLGVLHHTPDPQAGLDDCVRCLAPGAPFLVYLYYALDNRPRWYRLLWRASDQVRRVVSALPRRARSAAAQVVATIVYLPLARSAELLERIGVAHPPLAAYHGKPFYVMRTDALDRLGTPIEHRFTRQQVEAMMRAAGLSDVSVSDTAPFWCALGHRAEPGPA